MTKFFIQDTGVFRTDELVILNKNGVAVVQSVADENGLHDNKGVLEIIDYIAALEARLQEAEAIIKPFASEASFWGAKTPNDATPTIKLNNVGDEAAFTVGDLRAAAAFLDSK